MVVLVVAIYAVLFMDWDTRDTPFDGVSIFIGVGLVLWALC